MLTACAHCAAAVQAAAAWCLGACILQQRSEKNRAVLTALLECVLYAFPLAYGAGACLARCCERRRRMERVRVVQNGQLCQTITILRTETIDEPEW
eukprot:scaffold33431_cov21-Tisochrysis_lutea.AAC.2